MNDRLGPTEGSAGRSIWAKNASLEPWADSYKCDLSVQTRKFSDGVFAASSAGSAPAPNSLSVIVDCGASTAPPPAHQMAR